MPRSILTIAIASLLAASAWAADTPAEQPKAKPYPFDTCIVTGEKLGDMGGAITVVKDGQDVKFCCKGCIKAVDKDPAKYLAKLAAAVAAKDAAAKPAADAKP
jgi:hypothetical protein